MCALSTFLPNYNTCSDVSLSASEEDVTTLHIQTRSDNSDTSLHLISASLAKIYLYKLSTTLLTEAG